MKFCGREMYQEVSRNGHTKGCVKMRRVFTSRAAAESYVGVGGGGGGGRGGDVLLFCV